MYVRIYVHIQISVLLNIYCIIGFIVNTSCVFSFAMKFRELYSYNYVATKALLKRGYHVKSFLYSYLKWLIKW